MVFSLCCYDKIRAFNKVGLTQSSKKDRRSLKSQMFLQGKNGVLQKLAFAVNYDFGYIYLDKCGRTMNKILLEFPEWIAKDSPNPQIASLTSMDNGCTFSFSAFSFNLGLEMPAGGVGLSPEDVTSFIDQCDVMSRLTIDSLSLNAFTRIGFRRWYVFSFNNASESKDWLNSLGHYSINPKLAEAFASTLDAASVVVLLSGQERRYRLSFSSVERQAQLDLGEEILSVRASKLSRDQNKFLQKQLEARRRVHANPQFAALIDLDSFQENPISIDARDFVSRSMDELPARIAEKKE